jgi:hypothetical protein
MKPLTLAALLALLSACTTAPPPAPMSSPRPDDAGAPLAGTSYLPVMAGTAYHGNGSEP